MRDASNKTGSELSRRDFLAASAAAAGTVYTARPLAAMMQETPSMTPARQPIVIASANGFPWLAKAAAALRGKGDPLDAVLEVVTQVENDPKETSVGYGGLPNEDGVVELDACVMHGPTHKAGAVAALRNIKNPSLVARLVMQRTDHVLLVGEGALRFAKAHGFKEEDLLTDEARQKWLEWKESLSDTDDWLPPEQAKQGGKDRRGARGPDFPELRDVRHPRPHDRHPHPNDRSWGTITCMALDLNGDLAGTTTTSGLAFKLPGRVGDSPIIGAGLYVDNAVGAAGSTGRGEANLQNCSSFLIVELMRAGRSPEEACLEALKRVARHTEPRLRDKDGRPNFGLTCYGLAKDGRFGAATMWGEKATATSTPKATDAANDKSPESPKSKSPLFAVHDGQTAKLVECACLYSK